MQLGVDRTLRGISDGCSRCRCFAIFVTHQIKWIHTHRGESRHTTSVKGAYGTVKSGTDNPGQESKSCRKYRLAKDNFVETSDGN